MTKVVALGDVFWDHFSDISADADALMMVSAGAGYDAVESISSAAGGGGLQFAEAARQEGWTDVTLIGKVGCDTAGENVVRYLNASGVHALVARDVGLPTGSALIVYFAKDRRLMISDSGANTTLCLHDLTEPMRAAVCAASLMHVSGYMLMQDERRAAVLELIAEARSADTVVALDLVPHDLDRFIDTNAVLPSIFSEVDWVFAAESTVRRTLKPDCGDELQDLLSCVSFAENCSVAIYPHPSKVKVRHRGKVYDREFRYRAGGRSRGQSARTQARLLREFLPE